jgi:hypothetical protein
MRQLMIRYKVKPERVEENEELVRADRTDEGPVATGFDQIGSFRLIGDSTER